MPVFALCMALLAKPMIPNDRFNTFFSASYDGLKTYNIGANFLSFTFIIKRLALSIVFVYWYNFPMG
jgi:hypothetical protein